MNLNDILQLGALGVLALLLVMKDSKRDEFLQSLFRELKTTVDGNTSALNDLKEELRKGNKDDSANSRTRGK